MDHSHFTTVTVKDQLHFTTTSKVNGSSVTLYSTNVKNKFDLALAMINDHSLFITAMGQSQKVMDQSHFASSEVKDQSHIALTMMNDQSYINTAKATGQSHFTAPKLKDQSHFALAEVKDQSHIALAMMKNQSHFTTFYPSPPSSPTL